jgi:hypothetical protein
MHHINSRSSSSRAIAAAAIALASLALAACGGSSGTSTTTATSANSTARTPAASKRGFPGAARFAELRACLRKNGIALPQRTRGKRPALRAGGLLGAVGSPVLPKGVSRTHYEAILKKCGGGFAPGRLGAGTSRFESPEAKKALMRFAACMRENGIKLGEPNTSGKGPIFDTKGVATAGAKFAAAERKCRVDLRSAFRARPGAGAGAAAPPGASGAASPPGVSG